MRLTKFQTDTIIAAFKDGCGFSECARRAGLVAKSRNSAPYIANAVIRVLGENKLIYTLPDFTLPSGRRQCSRLIRRSLDIVEKYKNHESICHISRETGVSYQAIRVFLKEFGLLDDDRVETGKRALEIEKREIRQIQDEKTIYRTQIQPGFKQLNIPVPNDLFTRIGKLASDRDQTMKHVVCELLEFAINEKEKPEHKGFFSKLFR